MTHTEAKRFLERLNTLTIDMQRTIEDNAMDERIDDEVIPLMMDASDILSRVLDTDV